MKPRRGFALLMTLFLLALAMLVLAGIARHSLRLAWQAQQRQTELQRKWGLASLQRTLLADPVPLVYPDLNADAEPASVDRSPREAICTVQLGNWTFRSELADESCKADLNLALAVAGEDACEDLATALGPEGIRVGIDPLSKAAGSVAADLHRLRGWGQVFAGNDVGDAGDLMALAELSRLTLNGGPVHYRGAPDEVIEAMAEACFGAIVAGRAVSLRRDNPSTTVAEMIAGASTHPRNQEGLARIFADRSSSFSVRITGWCDSRQTHTMTIRRLYGTSLFRTFQYEW